MSKRLRKEQEAALQLKLEADEEDDKVKKKLERIHAPVIWCRLDYGFRIEDLQSTCFEYVTDMLKEFYIPQEVLLRNVDIEEDPVSYKSQLDHMNFILRDTTSVVAVHEESDEIAGVLLLKVVKKSEYDRVFSRNIYRDGEARMKIVTIISALERRIDVFKMFKCDVFLYFYALCIKDQFRKKNLGYQLMREGLNIARALGIKVANGIFTSFRQQKCAKRLEFKVIQEISYINWRDKNNELIFSDPGHGNYTCAFMVCQIPEKPIVDPRVTVVLSPAELRVVPPPRTRQEKRVRLEKERTKQQANKAG